MSETSGVGLPFSHHPTPAPTPAPAQQHIHHLYLHFVPDPQLNTKLDTMLDILQRVFKQEKVMSAELDALTQQVAQTDTVMDSAITLIQGLAQQVAAAGTDPAKLQALQNDLMAKSNSLAAAVQANAPVVPPTPAPTPAPTDAPVPVTPTPTDAPVPTPTDAPIPTP